MRASYSERFVVLVATNLTLAYQSRKCNDNLPLLEVARSKTKAFRAIEYDSTKLRPELRQ